MAQRYAVATGNWSNVAIWDGGTTLPGASDDVWAGGFTVTVDQDVTVLSLRTTVGASVANAGGGFSVTTAVGDRTINADIYAGTSICVTFSATSPRVLTLNGDVYAGDSGAFAGLAISSSGTVNMVGDAHASTSFAASGITVASTGVLNMTGNVYGHGASTGGISTSAGGSFHIIGNVYAPRYGIGQGLTNASTSGSSTIVGDVNAIDSDIASGTGLNLTGSGSTTTVTGNIYGGTSTPAYGCVVSGTHIFTLNGNLQARGGATGTNYGMNYTGTGRVTINGQAIGGIGASAVGIRATSSSANLYVQEVVGNDYPLDGIIFSNHGIDSANNNAVITVGAVTFGRGGVSGIGIGRYIVDTAANNFVKINNADGVTITMGEALPDYPTANNVRDGVTYDSGNLTGTMVVPDANTVLAGCPVGNTVGTVTVVEQDISDAQSPILVAFTP
jgi:hypothetical protein